MNKRVAYLLGAGASIDAGMPTTDEITDRVCYSSIETSGLRGEFSNIDDILRLICEMKCHWISYMPEGFTPSYEDIYFLAYQVSKFRIKKELNEFDNPAIVPYINELKKKGFSDAEGLSNDVCEYILFQVVKLFSEKTWFINSEENRLQRQFDCNYLLNLFKQPAQANSKIDIFTLNHDLVVEDFLTKLHMTSYDGFSLSAEATIDNPFRQWKPELYDEENRINLYKIHGSLGWNRRQGNNSKDTWVTDYLIEDQSIIKEHIILCGSYNKMFEYTFGIFAELWTRFYQALMKNDRLIVAGYGFGDRAVTNTLIHWIYKDNSRMLIISDKSKTAFIKHLEIISPSFKSVFDNLSDKIEYSPYKVKDLPPQTVENFLKY